MSESTVGRKRRPWRPPKTTMPKNILKKTLKTYDLEMERTATARKVETAPWTTGVPISANKKALKEATPHIVVGTPGRLKALIGSKDLNLSKLKHFVMDECDRLLEALDMRRDIQEIFRTTPHQKQVMMFPATLAKEIRPVCKKFCQDPM